MIDDQYYSGPDDSVGFLLWIRSGMKMTHLMIGMLAIYMVAILVAAPVRAQTDENPPNIIVILADDQSVDLIEGMSWPNRLDVHTPNLATLAEQSRVFRNARVNPKCSPTRAGVLSGRTGLQTGVIGYLVGTKDDTILLSLQTHETTIAEVLQNQGYQTLFVGKWHVGPWADGGQAPPDQGFDTTEFYTWYLHLDDPIDLGDEHVTLMVDLTLQRYADSINPEQPYALFLWYLDPHNRPTDRSGREPLHWWKVIDTLLPSGEPYYNDNPELDTVRDRCRAVAEAFDTELGRLLVELGVVDSQMQYLADSNSVVFFLGDNGLQDSVAPNPGRAKDTVYEGGIRVPFFVFGKGVPNDGLELPDLVTHTDVYETICDIVDIPEPYRGSFPRDSISFADAIGWSDPIPDRVYQICNQAEPKDANDISLQRVSLSDAQYKLIARAGGRWLAALNTDEFYDLVEDPLENDNLIEEGMTPDQRSIYFHMRDAIVDYWGTAVCEATPLMVDVPVTHAMGLNDHDTFYIDRLPIGYVFAEDGTLLYESRGFLRFDVEAIEDLLPPNRDFSDIASAQIIVGFKSDSEQDNETDTGPITIYPMKKDWFSSSKSWSQLEYAWDSRILGSIDLAPHIIPDPSDVRLSGPPMPTGTPVSFGHGADLMEALQYWHTHPDRNFGVVLMADPIDDLNGDQHVAFLNRGMLRLTLYAE